MDVKKINMITPFIKYLKTNETGQFVQSLTVLYTSYKVLTDNLRVALLVIVQMPCKYRRSLCQPRNGTAFFSVASYPNPRRQSGNMTKH